MPMRPVTPDDAEALAPFVAMAAFPPGRQAALELPHARRWLDGWGDELGFVWEADGRVVGAAWARVVGPALASDGGRAVPEAIVAVSEEARGRGSAGG